MHKRSSSCHLLRYLTHFVLCIFVFWSQPSVATARSYQEIMVRNLSMKPATALNLSVHETSPSEVDKKLFQLYQTNTFKPFWMSSDGISQRGEDIRRAIIESHQHGLHPGDYLLNNINQFWNRSALDDRFRLDIILTLAMVRYIADQREGRLQPKTLDPALFASASDVSINWQSLLQQAFQATDMKGFLAAQAPPFQQYQLLQKKLSQYRSIEENGGWPAIPAGPLLKPGAVDPRIPVLRKRLSITGDLLRSEETVSSTFDSALSEAVKRFQHRHNLTPDGIIGDQTLAALNRSVTTRIQQIIVNMERYRWLNRSQNERMVVVNIAGYELMAGKPGSFDITMPVIVGKTYHQTPVFSDTIKYVEFNPYWNIPPSIARDEILPKLQKDPRHLEKQDIRLFHSWKPGAEELDPTRIDWNAVSKKRMSNYFLRQDPGPGNALGTLKLMFPNEYNVYLHDTPAHNLFTHADRALSHGCIRMSRPAEMAAWVLGGKANGWSVERVTSVVSSKKRLVVDLPSAVPVYILYRTAVVDPDSKKLLFYPDIYKRDNQLIRAFWGH